MTNPTVTPAMRNKAEDNLKKAKVQLVLHQPFFASIILRRAITIDDTVPTAYVTASGKIVVGTEFSSKLTVQEMVFLLAHEAMHYAMMHQMRLGHRKHRPWNIACDKVINDILKQSHVGTPMKEGVFQDGAREFTAEQLYSEDEGGDGGKPSDDNPYEPGNGNDDLSPEGSDEVDEEQIEEIKRELIQARTAAKAQGKMPAAMEGIIQDIINPTTPWHQLLERFMLNLIKSGYSFRRPNKRYINHVM
jgi:predicted metal-dependent peptidase